MHFLIIKHLCQYDQSPTFSSTSFLFCTAKIILNENCESKNFWGINTISTILISFNTHTLSLMITVYNSTELSPLDSSCKRWGWHNQQETLWNQWWNCKQRCSGDCCRLFQPQWSTFLLVKPRCILTHIYQCHLQTLHIQLDSPEMKGDVIYSGLVRNEFSVLTYLSGICLKECAADHTERNIFFLPISFFYKKNGDCLVCCFTISFSVY